MISDRNARLESRSRAPLSDHILCIPPIARPHIGALGGESNGAAGAFLSAAFTARNGHWPPFYRKSCQISK